MQFTPKSKEEIEKEKASLGVWPAGDYDFEILEWAELGKTNPTRIYTEEKDSQKGNPMFVLVLSCVHPSGAKRIIIDHLLPKYTKFYDACVSCNMEEHYKSGHIVSGDFIGKTGKVRLRIEKDDTGQYGDKNKVSYYIIPERSNNDQPPAGHPANLNDDIPL